MAKGNVMANGKEIQKLKDTLDEKGCEFGRFTRKDVVQHTADINAIGKKMGRVYWIAISVLIGLIGNLIVMLIKK